MAFHVIDALGHVTDVLNHVTGTMVYVIQTKTVFYKNVTLNFHLCVGSMWIVAWSMTYVLVCNSVVVGV